MLTVLLILLAILALALALGLFGAGPSWVQRRTVVYRPRRRRVVEEPVDVVEPPVDVVEPPAGRVVQEPVDEPRVGRRRRVVEEPVDEPRVRRRIVDE